MSASSLDQSDLPVRQWYFRRDPNGNAFWCAPQVRRVASRKSRQTAANDAEDDRAVVSAAD